MSIPAGLANPMCQILKPSGKAQVKVYENTTGADVAQGDFIVLDDLFCGVVDLDSEDGSDVSVSVTEGMNILTSATAAASTFDTQGDEVFWDEDNQEFTDVSASGLFRVGALITPKTSGGQIMFEKFRYVAEVVA